MTTEIFKALKEITPQVSKLMLPRFWQSETCGCKLEWKPGASDRSNEAGKVDMRPCFRHTLLLMADMATDEKIGKRG